MYKLIGGLLVVVVALAILVWAGGQKRADKPVPKKEAKAEAQPQAEVEPPVAAGIKLETDEQKTFYALGVSMGDSFQQQFNPSPEEVEVFKAGLLDGVLEHKPQLKVEDYRAKFQPLVQARTAKVAEEEKKASEEFLNKMAKEKGAVKTDSGLIFIKEKEGKGASPKPTDGVKVHYQGTLRDGTVFDSSVQRGTPATFPLKGVIPCWTEGLQKIKVGGKAKLVCPSSIAYGDRGKPPKIKPGATLVFEVELLEITKAGLPPEHP